MEWLFTGLTQGLGLGLAAVAIVGAGIAALWSIVGIYLGRWFEQDDTASSDEATPNATVNIVKNSTTV